MIVAYAHDGAKYDALLIQQYGFKLNTQRDLDEVAILDSQTGDNTGQTELIYNFVGFVTNSNNDTLVVFPKHFRVDNVEKDAKDVFDCISRHKQKRPEEYIGGKCRYNSNFPFASLFGVYDYYQKYGLYLDDEIFIKPNAGDKISWKDTIRKSDKFIINEKLLFSPLFFKKKNHFANFITDCMIFAIDYAVAKFGFLLNIQETGQPFPAKDMFAEKEYVINTLQQIRQKTFKDNVQNLIDNLINFFECVNEGGSYYIKHYTFSSVWEDIVASYLSSFYDGIDNNNRIILTNNPINKLNFEKKAFHINEAKLEQYIAPDYYCEAGKTQLIFDAKYYNAIHGMDYKQITYLFVMKGLQGEQGTQKFSKTYSALILPSETRKTTTHFKLDKKYGLGADILIMEEYFDIRETIENYLRNK